MAKPLNDLLKKDQKFEWTEECQRAFDDLKKRFTEESVLTMPDQTRPFQIETDASKYATGAVLTQLDSNGNRHPISLYQKPFHQQNETMKSMNVNYLGIGRMATLYSRISPHHYYFI